MNSFLPKSQTIRMDAKKLLNKGHTKQETYELLLEKYPYTTLVAEEVRWLPTLKAKKKYQVWNYLLMLIMLFWAITSLMAGLKWFNLLAPLVFAYIAARMLIKHYHWFALLSLFGLIGILVVVLTDWQGLKSQWIEGLIALILTPVPAILAYWLRTKLSPKPLETEQEYVNADGERRIRLDYSFKD